MTNHPQAAVFAIAVVCEELSVSPHCLIPQGRLVQPDAQRHVLALVVEQRVHVRRHVIGDTATNHVTKRPLGKRRIIRLRVF